MAGVRLARKQATRERVIAAARDLFVEVGYDAATIRMIAQRAGVATGSVFTTFASKLEILHLVMVERLERLYAELDGVRPHLRGSTTDRLCSIMAVHYDFEMKRPKLFTAYLAANFEWSETPVVTFGANQRLRGMLREILVQGVDAGEVQADADLDLFLDVMLASYGMNYRLAAQQGMQTPALIDAMDRQINLAFKGICV